jgi:putative salt-induced outer membrane protein YdiY
VTRVVRTAFVALAVLCGLVLPAHARPKTDVVVLKNGDRITCEIKNLNRGKLTVKTDDMGTLYIEWNNIASVTSTGLFEIEDLAGHLYFGPLETIPDEGLQVATADGIETVPLATIARMLNYEASFWSRLSGSLDVGFAYTKSSELSEFSADGSVKYTQPTFSAELSGSSLIQRQTGATDTTRNTLAFVYTRSFERRRFALGRVSADQNRELGYELRAGLAAAWGQYLVRNQGHELPVAAGLSLNREVPVDGEAVNNLEAVLAFDWARFAYDFPKTDVELLSFLYLGLTNWGRYRVDLDLRVSRELFSDFTFVVKGYYNYDSEPPTEGASQDDYSVSLGVGYTF